MKIALKVDVDTYRGTLLGVPQLVGLLEEAGARATFLFSLGPDHTGRAIRRALRPGFMRKVSRTSVLAHYGLKTLLYGTLLPGPDIGRCCAGLLRTVRDAGFEVGIHTWDHVRWQDGVARASMQWTEREMGRAVARFTEIFGQAPHVHGAAGWQMNRHAVRLTQRLGFRYASDGRGEAPFVPVWEGEPIHCPQIPTTLPTLDELIGLDGVDEGNVAEALLSRTAGARTDQVFTLHAELEGMKLSAVLRTLLRGWQAQGHQLVDLAGIAAGLDLRRLPRHELAYGEIPGRSGQLLVQGPEFLAGPPPALTGLGNPLLGTGPER